jgi:hypothetical protein
MLPRSKNSRNSIMHIPNQINQNRQNKMSSQIAKIWKSLKYLDFQFYWQQDDELLRYLCRYYIFRYTTPLIGMYLCIGKTGLGKKIRGR